MIIYGFIYKEHAVQKSQKYLLIMERKPENWQKKDTKEIFSSLKIQSFKDFNSIDSFIFMYYSLVNITLVVASFYKQTALSEAWCSLVKAHTVSINYQF